MIQVKKQEMPQRVPKVSGSNAKCDFDPSCCFSKYDVPVNLQGGGCTALRP